MKKKNSLTFFKLIENLFQAYLDRMVDLAKLASLEGQLAGKTLLQLIVLYFLLGVLLVSTWLSLLAVLFIGLIAFHFSWLMASLIVVALNFFLLLGICLFILRIRKNMLFPATRQQLSATHAKAIKDRAIGYE